LVYSNMPEYTTTAEAHPNIALIKYWGDRDPSLHIPANGSISMNLAGMLTRTRVSFVPGLAQDRFILNDKPADTPTAQRVSKVLDRVRTMAGIDISALVESQNNFPTGAGIASSASGFAALALAASRAAGLELDERDLSRLARTGSGSACRSIPAGFVEWQAGTNDEDSYAYTLASPKHWDLVDCIAVVSQEEKQVSSSEGHALAYTSILQNARVSDASRRLDICRQAILERDIEALAQVVELDSNLMHAVMFTSNPPVIYWLPETVRIMQAVQSIRKTGLPVCYTVDAGPNVHVLCPSEMAGEVANQLGEITGIAQLLMAHPGGAARVVNGINNVFKPFSQL
jgi:diphosphomevalonate decarboxylase